MLTSTPKPVKHTSCVSERTKRRRNSLLFGHLETISGSTKQSTIIQAGSLLKRFSQNDRNDILKQANIVSYEIDEESLVAMKVDMGIPWQKLKTMARYNIYKNTSRYLLT